MIKTEMVEDRIRHYSDAGFMIYQVETGNLYEDAVDVVPCPYTYEETETPIERELDAQQVLDILMGESNG